MFQGTVSMNIHYKLSREFICNPKKYSKYLPFFILDYFVKYLMLLRYDIIKFI